MTTAAACMAVLEMWEEGGLGMEMAGVTGMVKAAKMGLAVTVGEGEM